MQNLEIQFISCPKCGSAKEDDPKKICSECSGIGIGTFFKGKFLFWNFEFDSSLIFLKKIEKAINIIINFLAGFILLIGLISLSWWIYEFGNFYHLESLYFWDAHHFLLLMFWAGVLAGLFFIFRLSIAKTKKIKIKKNLFKQKVAESAKLPNNWQELKNYQNKINTADGLGQEAFRVLKNAFEIALKNNFTQILPAHIFLAVLKENEPRALFSRLNVSTRGLEEKGENYLNRLSKSQKTENKKSKILISEKSKEVLILAYINSFLANKQEISSLHVLASIFGADKNIVEILYEFGIEENSIKNVIDWFRVNDKMVENYKRYRKIARFKPASNMDRAYTAVETPVLNHFSHDLTLAAKYGYLEFCVARNQEINSIFSAIESGNHGVILVGPSGVGKRAVISGIAEMMTSEEVPEILKDKRLLELDVSKLISGVDASKAQGRMMVALDEVIRSGNIILFIDNLENLAGISSGEEESLELIEILADAIDKKQIYCFGLATNENYAKYLEGKPIGKSMKKVEVNEPEGDQAIRIIQSKIGAIEYKYKIYFSYHAIERAVKLSKKYMHDTYLPEKAIKILESAAVETAKRCKKDPRDCICTDEDVAIVISELTKIPASRVSEDESKILLNLEAKIHERMINQEQAVNMVADSLRRARAELREGKRPIASFLFLGPTGVGKTELAKSVSEIYFGGEEYMLRLDMSEYQHEDSITKMIGDEGGSLGYLTEAVRKKPFSLVLLDEFEKAHPNILNLFLQVMDDGRLTDGQGRTIDFTNSIIIATSNVGAVYIQEEIQKNQNIQEIKKVLIEEHLTKVIKPELINRFDGVIVFSPLEESDIVAIAELMLANMKKILSEKNINLEIHPEGLLKLAHEGYDPKFGARPLRRLLQDKVENIIANKLLTKEVGRRDTVFINQSAEIEIIKAEEL